jgi:hypothetical protein
MSKASSRRISSPAFQGGASPCGSPGGRRTSPYGQEAVRASLSRLRASVGRNATNGTSGLSSSASSRSAGLQLCLARTLVALLEGSGSPEYVLTYKSWDTESGWPIFAARASRPPTSAKGSTGLLTGWATPTRGDAQKVKPFHDAPQPALAYQCHLAGWVSPGASDGNGGKGVRKGVSATGKMPDGSKAHMDLSAFTKHQLAGWPTPKVFDGQDGGNPRPVRFKGNAPSEQGHNRDPEAMSSYRGDLKDWVPILVAGWATPTVEGRPRSPEFQKGRELNALEALASGTPTTSSTAATTSSGALCPGHSRWLQGFPETWDQCSPNFEQWATTQKLLASSSATPAATAPDASRATATPSSPS